MNKRSFILVSAAVIFIGVLSVGTLLKPDVKFSENENRYLEQKPEFNIKNVIEGKFEAKSEEYLSDQILGRESWVRVKGMTEAAIGINDMNGVYLCKGGRVVERITEKDFDKERFDRNLSQAQELMRLCKMNDIKFNTMLVPTAGYVYADTLPFHALTFDENKAFSKANDVIGDSFIDIRNTLMAKKRTGNVFFNTDHHWTGYGALAAYEVFAKNYGDGRADALYQTEDLKVLSDNFKGTLYSKVLLNTLETDIIETLGSALEAGYEIEIEGEKFNSLYFKDFLKKKDKYAVYFGGNYDRVDLKMTDPKNAEKLLIIKDSFANSFVPYLLNDFAEISMIDTRFYRGDISDLVTEYDQVLILYSINNFATEKIVLLGSLMR